MLLAIERKDDNRHTEHVRIINIDAIVAAEFTLDKVNGLANLIITLDGSGPDECGATTFSWHSDDARKVYEAVRARCGDVLKLEG